LPIRASLPVIDLVGELVRVEQVGVQQAVGFVDTAGSIDFDNV
jgi:hypothetical protein